MKYLIFVILLIGCEGYESEPVGCVDQWDAVYDAAVEDTLEGIASPVATCVESIQSNEDLTWENEDLKGENGNLRSIIKGLMESHKISEEMLIRCEKDIFAYERDCES